MASHRADQAASDNTHNPHSSSSRWRHQESSAYLRHAGRQPADAREEPASTAGLANFLNSERVEPADPSTAHGNAQDVTVAAAHANQLDGAEAQEPSDGKEIVCGPLLNYRHTSNGRWFGSVLVVVKGGGKDVLYQPSLFLRRVGEAKAVSSDPVTNGDTNGAVNGEGARGVQFESHRLYSDPRNTFWAFDINVEIEEHEIKHEYTVPGLRFSSKTKPQTNHFFVHARDESMRIMFHSCNGFSVGTDEKAWSGAALWNDVNRKHTETPFHVMLGGGDQIYNDGIRVHGPLRAWTSIGNPKKRQDYPFPEKLRAECDDYYLKNYIRWYSTEPFATTNGQIPQLNIWDDHDIIDGFGSYVDAFMRCDVFRGIGGIAHKYYMLFQHHLPPPASTYTSDHRASRHGADPGPDPTQLVDTFVAEPKTDQQYIVGSKPGPYVAEHSFNMYARLGARMAMMGIDARTERTRHQVNYPETYDLVYGRVRKELAAAASSGQPIKHLIVLLGIPIAYPRLTWLENILRSPLIGPVKFMSKRFGVGGGLFNQFDGGVDLLDDLDDHYTARQHKPERAQLVESLQTIAAEYSVRVTILGGDVHLAALGRFYSNPKLKVPTEQDHRYVANVVSSAIVNKPPPQAVANLLARRNKIHHLNHDTDETLLNLFNKDPGNSNKTSSANHCTMPSRNFAMLTENSPNQVVQTVDGEHNGDLSMSFSGKDGHDPLHSGELEVGTGHKAAHMATHGKGHDGSLDICINVEVDQHNSEGHTEGYGLTVPLLTYTKKPVTPATANSHGSRR